MPATSDTGPRATIRDWTEIAVERGYCSAEQLAAATAEMTRNGGTDLAAFLVNRKILSNEQLHASERAARGTSVIAGFEILEKVGQGGMGAVFRARQISMERIVALKILPPKLAKNPGFKQRFLHEARVSAKLSHLNIISGIDCGEESGYTFFAMEFVEGRTVRQILKERGKLPAAEALEIVMQMANALIYARKQNMVHRDIKPDNIMMAAGGVAKLCDLGLAKETESDDASQTKEGVAVGTPHFISPEQARGEAHVDFHSDIYSLGGSFYHMITGKTPFTGQNSSTVMALHISSETKNPCDIAPEIPLGYGQIVSRMMAKLPADRYTPEELAADLEAVKAGRAPAAASFRARSSCALPSKMIAEGAAASASKEKSAAQPGRNVKPLIGVAVALGVVCVVLLAVVLGGGGGDKKNDDVAKATPPPDEVKAHPPKQIEPEPPHKIDTPPPAVTPTPNPEPPPETKKNDPPPPVPAPTPVPTPAPQVVAPTEPPVKPPEVVTPPPPPPAVVEMEAPKLVLTADVLYTRFLKEARTRTATMDLPKALTELTDLAKKPEYAVAKDDLKAELADLAGAVAFERDSLNFMAKTKVTVNLNPDAKRVPAMQGKVISYEPGRGVEMDFGGAGTTIPAVYIATEDIFKHATDPSDLGKLRYADARGILPQVEALLPNLKDAEPARWERKRRLAAADEMELVAQIFFANMQRVAEAKSFKTLGAMIDEFQKKFGTTEAAQKGANTLNEWRAAGAGGEKPAGVEGIPWLSAFHGASVKAVDGGYLEVTYDFATPGQAKDFSCAHGPVTVAHNRMFIAAGGGELGHAKMTVPIEHLKYLQVVGRSHHDRKRRLRIVFMSSNRDDPPEQDPCCTFRNGDPKVSLDNFGKQVGANLDIEWQREDIDVVAEDNDGELKWTVNGQPIGAVQVTKFRIGRYLALAGENGNHSWKKIKIVFRPDDKWLREQILPPKK